MYTNQLLKFANIFYKLAISIRTQSFDIDDPNILKYKDEIIDILRSRYVDELGYNVDKFNNLYTMDLSILGIDKVNLSIDSESDRVVGVSAIDQKGRVKFVAFNKPKTLYDSKSQLLSSFDHIRELFGKNKIYAEVTVDLYDKITRLYNLYKKRNKDDDLTKIYIYPAESAAVIIPKRFLLVSDDGVKYQKRVVGANTFEIYFETNHLNDLFSRLIIENVKFIHSIMEHPWGQRAFRIRDIDNHIIEFAESMESVVIRLKRQGLSLEEIENKSSMPMDFIKITLNKINFQTS